MGPPDPAPAVAPERRSWLVPTAVAVVLLLGPFFAWFLVESFGIDPSGIVQPVGSPLPEQLESFDVLLLFGAPWAAVATAAIAFFGLRRRRAWPYAIVGVAAGLAVWGVVAVRMVGIGRWWVYHLPSDTNRTAALLGVLLIPPSVLSVLLAAESAPVPRDPRWGSTLGRFVTLGIVVGLGAGAFLGGSVAVLTWSVHCPETIYVNCFSASGVLSGGQALGALEGALIGAGAGFVAWLVRLRGPADRAVPSGG
jgi:hypothetical protein